MSQDARSNSVLTNSSRSSSQAGGGTAHHATEASHFSAGDYADRLLDDLFQDVEQLLDVELPNAEPPVAPNPPSYEPVPQAPISPAIASASTVSAATATDLALPLATPTEPTLAPAVHSMTVPSTPWSSQPASVPAPILVEPQRHSPSVVDRLLLGLGCISVMVALAFWLLYQEMGRKAVVGTVPQAAVDATAESNSQFADYVQKALQNIDQRSQAGNVTAQATNGENGAMPTVTIPKTNVPNPLAARSTTGLERIYVPVYQIPPNLYPPGSAVAPLPRMPGLGKPQAPAPTTAGPKAAAPQPVAVTRKLVGVLDQGKDSIALFEVNGVTQRYAIGESIGSSGWTLVEVTKDQALIRRNGEVRSLFVGHSF